MLTSGETRGTGDRKLQETQPKPGVSSREALAGLKPGAVQQQSGVAASSPHPVRHRRSAPAQQHGSHVSKVYAPGFPAKKREPKQKELP